MDWRPVSSPRGINKARVDSLGSRASHRIEGGAHALERIFGASHLALVRVDIPSEGVYII